ncbi:MAG: IS200/IS605 family element RNA-guided endonuclease TnpB [Desulfitobacteriaceae bacterium]|nr:IS200/IS605 family element RNA-guided endonuclease TnpB [Desulfitobacteriaceae bacterium]MDI6915448.1 IS200/IS605 family element RNA-guided endonuclease TnpB [Desulfitobacteriaceae bacterium]
MCEKAYRLRLYPTEEQKTLIHKTIGCARYVYNKFLAMRNDFYNAEKKSLSYNQCSAALTGLKQEESSSWLQEVDKFALQNSLRDLDRAYVNFFECRARFPRFKSKHGKKQSYRTNFTNNNIAVNLECRAIKLPKLGWVEFRTDKKLKEFPEKLVSATVRRTPSNKYYVSVICETEVKQLPSVSTTVGVDLGIKDLAILSNGEHIPNPKYYRKSEQKLVRLQQAYSRKRKGSLNQEKARLQVARQHEKVANQRKDLLHQLSSKLIHENQVVCIEELKVKNLIKNKKLAKSIQDAGWGMFRAMLEYKARWYGRIVSVVDPFYPSTKTCHNCGHKVPMLTLDVRSWQCPVCRSEHNRDENAAKNILNEGLRILAG